MNLADLQATVEANKGPIFAVAAAGVAGFALWHRHTAAAAGATAGTGDTATPAGVVPFSAGGQTAGMGGYDSTSADLAGYLGPQLEAIQQLIEQQQAPTPVPANPTPPAKVSTQPVGKPTPVHPTPVHPTPVSAGPKYAVNSYYTVKPGDSLSAIAARYPQQSITWQSIYGANKGVIGGNPNLIHPGQKLLIRG